MFPTRSSICFFDALRFCRRVGAVGLLAAAGSARAAFGVGEGGLDPEPRFEPREALAPQVLRIEMSVSRGPSGGGVLMIAQAQRPLAPPATRSDFVPPRTPAEGLPMVRDERREWLRRGRELRDEDADGERVRMSREERRALRAAIRDAGYQLYVPPRDAAMEPPPLPNR